MLAFAILKQDRYYWNLLLQWENNVYYCTNVAKQSNKF